MAVSVSGFPGSLAGLEGEGGVDCEEVDVGFGADADADGGAGGIRVVGSIWQRTRTSLGLWQRVQFLR